MRKEVKFLDYQTGDYSHHNTIQGLYTMLCEGYCECGEGYDHLDKKDGVLKCRNCLRLNNLESISKEDMIGYIQECEYNVEEYDRLEKGDKFIIDTTTCTDQMLLDWYEEQDDKILIADQVEEGTWGVWVKGCEFRIDLDEIEIN